MNEERIGAKVRILFMVFKYTAKNVESLNQPGWYIRLHIKNVPSHFVAGLPADYPLCVIGMMPHEQRMSVVNFILKRPAGGRDQQAIPSKERLIFHCGYRRFAVCPIFSQHTAANKHKVQYVIIDSIQVAYSSSF